MNLLRRWLIGKDISKLIEQQKSLQPGVRYQISPAGIFISPVENEQNYIDNGYNINDIVYSCVQLIVDKVRLAPWGLYKVDSESSLKQYKALISRKDLSPDDYRRAKRLRKEALVPLENLGLQEGKLSDLLRYPNDNETWSDFIAYGAMFKLITGNKYVWGDILGAGANKGVPDSFNVLPSHLTRLIIDGNFPAKATGYRLETFGQVFTADQVLHEKYPNPTWSINGSQLYGMSPLKSAISGVISRNNSAAKSTAAMYKNRGMEDIIYIDNPDITPEQGLQQAQALKNKIVNEFSGEDARGKHAISGMKVGVVNLGLTAKDMEIIAAEKWDMARICNLYGVPVQLLNEVERSTFNNLKEAEKALTTRSAIPLLTSFRDQLNRKLQSVWGFKGKNVYVDYDITCYSELSENMGDTAKWVTTVPWFTPNEQRELLDMEALPNPEFDEAWITPQMGQPYSEWEISEVDQNINDDGAGDANNGNAAVSGDA